MIVILISALAGVGALAGGRVFGNHGASKVGVSMLVTAVGALVVYVGLYAFLSGFGHLMSPILTRSRRVRSWLTMIGIGILLICLAWGLIVFIWSVAAGTGTADTPPAPTGSVTGTITVPANPAPAGDVVEAQRDRLAAAPMLTVPLSAARPQALAPTGSSAAVMSIPVPEDAASAVPVRFPRTPEGAVAALAVIDTAAFAGLNPATVATVHQQAALSGAVSLPEWTPAVGVDALLRAAGAPGGSPEVSGSWTLTHAQVKGVLENGGFVVACVLGELAAGYHTVDRVGLGTVNGCSGRTGGGGSAREPRRRTRPRRGRAARTVCGPGGCRCVVPDVPNPVSALGGALGSSIAEAAASAFNTAMKAVWDFAVTLLGGVFAVVDHLTTPDLDPRTGPLASVLPATVWVGGAVLVILSLIQVGKAAMSGGTGLLHLFKGIAQYLVVTACGLGLLAGFATAANAAALGILVLRVARGLLGWDRRREQRLAERRERRLRGRAGVDRPARGHPRRDQPACHRAGAGGRDPGHRRDHPDRRRRAGRRGHRTVVLDRAALAAGACAAHPHRRDRDGRRAAAGRRCRRRHPSRWADCRDGCGAKRRHRAGGGRGAVGVGVLPAGAVQAVRVRRPRHTVRAAAAHLHGRHQLRRDSGRADRDHPAGKRHRRAGGVPLDPGPRRVSEAHRVLGGAAQGAMSTAAPVLAAAGVGSGADPDTPTGRSPSGAAQRSDGATGSTGPTGSNGQEQGSPSSDPPTTDPPTPPDVIPPPRRRRTRAVAQVAGRRPRWRRHTPGRAGGRRACWRRRWWIAGRGGGGGGMSDTPHPGWRRERFGPFARTVRAGRPARSCSRGCRR